MKKIDNLINKAYSSYVKYQLSCDNVLMYLTPFFIDFPQEILEQLAVDFQPSDGLVISDGDSNVYSLSHIIEIVKNKGIITFSEFKSFSI